MGAIIGFIGRIIVIRVIIPYTQNNVYLRFLINCFQIQKLVFTHTLTIYIKQHPYILFI